VPHAHHFLERLDRVTREQTEFALSLYRDHEAVAFVLSKVNLPEGADRVALEVDHAAGGPVVLVSRDGHFVTCLGVGMRHDHPVVPRARLDALLAKVADKRARRELAKRELRPDEEEGDLFHRILTRGSRLSREDFLAVTAFEPMLGASAFMAMLDIGVDALQARASAMVDVEDVVVNGRTKKILERLHRLEWGVAHMTVLSGAADRESLDKFLSTAKAIRTSPTYTCAAQGGSTFYLRAAYMAARFGKAVIPSYKAGFVEAKQWDQVLDATFGLAAIGLRHSASMGEVRKFLEPFGAVDKAPTLIDGAKVLAAKWVGAVLANADEQVENGYKFGRNIATFLGEHLPEGHPHRYTEDAAVPEDIARTCVLSFDAPLQDDNLLWGTMCALPLAARANAEEFYLPRELVRLWLGPWQPEETLERLKRVNRLKKKQAPVRATATPGRNDPCTCGSGKKWKKCHGAVGAVP
jgi:SEC-C motif